MKTAVLAALLAAACGGKAPRTHYYQLAAPAPAKTTGTATIALEPLATEEAYDDDRIVYRTTPYRLDYYHYHRWSAPPGVMIGNYLEQALERSGHVRAVVREASDQASVVLGGRVVAIEEVDRSRTDWRGRIVVELTLTDARTHEVLWSQQFEELEPLRDQSPEGLARALSRAMARITARAAPKIAELASRQAVAHER